MKTHHIVGWSLIRSPDSTPSIQKPHVPLVPDTQYWPRICTSTSIATRQSPQHQYPSPHTSLSSSTRSSTVTTLLPSSLSFCFLSSLVTRRLGVIGVSGVKGMYGLYGVIGTPVLGVPRLRSGTLRSRTVALIIDGGRSLWLVPPRLELRVRKGRGALRRGRAPVAPAEVCPVFRDRGAGARLGLGDVKVGRSTVGTCSCEGGHSMFSGTG